MRYYNIPIFVPHKGCNFDCVFCNQKHITGEILEVDETYIEKTVKKYLKTLPRTNRKIEIAFFGGSFTGIDFDMQRRFLSTAYEFVKNNEVDGIRLSTRPDYIDEKILNQLEEFGVTTVELGVQSLDDEVLEKSNRGHTQEDVKKAVSLIKKYPFSLGLQMMTGLPGDSDEKALQTADKIIQLKPDFVRIYPTLVIKDTQLEVMYKSGEYTPQSINDAVELCKKLMLKFEKAGVRVIRVALQTTEEISPGGAFVAGPYDAQFRELVEASIYYDKFEQLIKNNDKKTLTVCVNTKEISKAIGRKRENIIKASKNLGVELKVIGSDSIKKGECLILD